MLVEAGTCSTLGVVSGTGTSIGTSGAVEELSVYVAVHGD